MAKRKFIEKRRKERIVERELKKELRRLRTRNGWRADFEYFNPKQNRSVDFGIL